MKLQEQMASAAAASTNTLGFIGTELLTIMQVIFFLFLGYMVTSVWRALKPRAVPKVSAKKVDDVDEPVQCEEEVAVDSPSQPVSKGRLSNAVERKKTRKATQPEPKKKQPINVVTVVPEELPRPAPQEEVLVVEEMPPTSSVSAAQAAERIAKLIAKKEQRKARKAESQKTVEEEVAEEQTAVEEQPQPATCESFSADAAKPDEPDAVEQVEEEAVETFPAYVAAKCDKPDSDTSSQDGQSLSQTASTLSMVNSGIASSESDSSPRATSTPEEPQPEEDCTTEDAQPEPKESMQLPVGNASMNFDDIESDSDSEVDTADYAGMQLSMPQELPNPSDAEMANAPVMWCSLPTSPSMADGSTAEMPQISGWMAVIVPTECAPAGAFDGLWKNNADEKILIDKLEIMFECGMTWNMEMHSVNNLSVTVEGQTIDAQLDASGTQLLWSDGDVWNFFGSAQDGPTECPPQPAMEIPMEMPMMMPYYPEEGCMMSPPVYDEQMMGNEQMMGMPAMCDWMPTPAPSDKWEICWDWKKKGRCPRTTCEWYHPEPEASF